MYKTAIGGKIKTLIHYTSGKKYRELGRMANHAKFLKVPAHCIPVLYWFLSMNNTLLSLMNVLDFFLNHSHYFFFFLHHFSFRTYFIPLIM